MLPVRSGAANPAWSAVFCRAGRRNTWGFVMANSVRSMAHGARSPRRQIRQHAREWIAHKYKEKFGTFPA
jgi:hypothetical protein